MPVNAFVPDNVDVLVVGAGPAGLAATNELVRAKASVLLVDAKKTIGSPLRCGELTRDHFFEIYGIEHRPEWVRWVLDFQWGKAPILNRERFEYHFANLLQSQGAIVRKATSVVAVSDFDGIGRKVTLLSHKRNYSVHARCIIAADGVSSRVAHLCGIDTYLSLDKIGSCLAYRIVNAKLADSSHHVVRYLPNFFPFYFWVIPSGKDQANVGIVLPANKGFMVRRLLKKCIEESKEIKGGKIAQTIVGGYPICTPLETPYSDGLLVTGTAARLIERSVGEGIWQAAVSGKIAALLYQNLSAKPSTADRLSIYREKIDFIYNDLSAKWKKRQETYGGKTS